MGRNLKKKKKKKNILLFLGIVTSSKMVRSGDNVNEKRAVEFVVCHSKLSCSVTS